MTRALRTLLLAGVAALALPMTAHAAVAADDPWAGVEVMEDSEMAAARGGFVLPNGVEVNFAAKVNTFAGGMLALQTDLVITDDGLLIDHQLGELGEALSALSDADKAELGLTNVNAQAGVVIRDTSGVTALVQGMSESGLQNLILNTASGRDLRQEIELTITLPGFASVQEMIGQELLGLRLGDDLNAMLARN